MARFSIRAFLNGINTRLNKFRLSETDAVDSENVDLSTLELRPQKGLNTGDTTFTSIDYKLKGFSVTDASAEKFTESGNYLLKSYDDANAQFDRVYYDSSGPAGLVGSKTLGVPSKPDAPNVSVVTSGSAGGTAISKSNLTTSSFSSLAAADSTNGFVASLPSGNVTNHAASYNFSVFRRFGTVLVMFDPTIGRLRRINTEDGSNPSNVNLDVTVTNYSSYFFVGDYFVGLDANYTSMSKLQAASDNTETIIALSDTPSYTAWNNTTKVPGFTSYYVHDKEYSVNDGHVFITKNYKGVWRDYQASATTLVNTQGGSYYYPTNGVYSIKADRPILYIMAGHEFIPQSSTDMLPTGNNDPTIQEGWLWFYGYYNGQTYGSRTIALNGTSDTKGRTYLQFYINGIRYIASILSHIEAWSYQSGVDVFDAVSSTSTLSSANFIYRNDLRHACWIYPIDPESESSASSFIGSTEIYSCAVTGVSGTVVHQGDHDEGTHTNINFLNPDNNEGSTWPPNVGSSGDQYGYGGDCTVVVDSNGDITGVTVTSGGRGYLVGDKLELATDGTGTFGFQSNDIGGSSPVILTVTSIDDTFEVKVNGNSKFAMNLTNGQITGFASGNAGGSAYSTPAVRTSNSSAVMPLGGIITRVNLSSGAKTYKTYSDSISSFRPEYHDWGFRFGADGTHSYKLKRVNNNRKNDADYDPIRSNYLLGEANYVYPADNQSTGYDSDDNLWTQVNYKTYLVADDASEWSNSTFSITSGAPSSTNGSTDDTLTNNAGTALADGWNTMKGDTESTDAILKAPFGTTTINIFRNVLASGNQQFGTIQATLSLGMGGWDILRRDGYNAVYINSGGSGDTIRVINLATLAAPVDGQTFYGIPSTVSAEDVAKDGDYVIVKTGTNQNIVIDTDNDNEVSLKSFTFDFFADLDVNLNLIGVRVSAGRATNVEKFYPFWMHEIKALTTGGIRDNRNSSSYNRNITDVLDVASSTNTIVILFTHDGASSFETDNEDYYLVLGSNRIPNIKAIAYGTSFQAIYNSATSTTKITSVPNSNMHNTVIGDILTIGRSDVVVNGYNGTTEITFTGTAAFTDSTCDYNNDPTITMDSTSLLSAGFTVAGTGIPSGATVSSVTDATTFELSASTTGGSVTNGTLTFTSSKATAQTITRKRYVFRNRCFSVNSAYSNMTIPTLPTFSITGAYSGVNEMITFDTASGIASTVKFIPTYKTSESTYTDDSGSGYFHFELDRSPLASNTDIGTQSWSYGGLNIYDSAGANIPFQYRITLLRDISHSSEEDVLIEGPLSAETDEKSLGSTLQSLQLTNMPSGLDADIKYVRIYRVGGNFAKYYWLTDVDVSNNSTPDYDDISSSVGSVLIVPQTATNTIQSKLENIIYVNGLYVGSSGSKVYFSEFGNPHSWPVNGEYDIDHDITAMVESDGEALIFTENSIHRARGYSYDSINTVSIPQSQGVSVNNKFSVVKHQGGVYFISNDGLCFYRGGSVTIVSKPKLESIPSMTGPRSAVKDSVLYMFPTSGNVKGLKMDMRGSAGTFSRIDQKASLRAFYYPPSDKLYIKDSAGSGSYDDATGSDLSIVHESGEFSFGDLDETKIYFGMVVRYKTSSSSGSGASINVYADESTNSSHAVTLADTTSGDTIYAPITVPVFFKTIRYKIVGKVTVHELTFEQEQSNAFSVKKRFLHADVQFNGVVKADLYLDGAVKTSNPNYETSGSTSIPISTGTKTVRLYFPEDTVGYVPHVYFTGAGSVTNVDYGTEDL